MKKTKRITRFEVETERTLIFRRRGGRHVYRCQLCGALAEVEVVTAGARAAAMDELVVDRQVETGRTCFGEEGGHVLICLNTAEHVGNIAPSSTTKKPI